MRMGASERRATVSICSMSWLKFLLRVWMPDFRMSWASAFSWWKRDARRSYFERSRSMMVKLPGFLPAFLPRGGPVWMSLPGRCCDSVRRNRQIWATWVPVVMWV